MVILDCEKICFQQQIQVPGKLPETHVASGHYPVSFVLVVASTQNGRDKLQIGAAFRICTCKNG